MIKLKSLLEVEGTEPGIYYHVTFQKKLGKIQKDGLVAQKKGEWHGAAGQDIRQVKGVFVFENYYDAMSWCFKTNWDRPTEKLVILKLKTNDTDFVEDSHWQASGIGKWMVKQSPFKPSDIVEVIPFDIDKWTPELTLKMNALRRQSNGISEDLSSTIKLKDLILEKVETKWKQKMSRDEMTAFLSDYGHNWQGEIGYDEAKEISGYPDSGQWELKEIPLSNFPNLLADPKKVSRMPIVTFGQAAEWEIADGKHRVGAAKARGEKTIMGYVPVESKE